MKTAAPFSRAALRRYWFNGETIRFLGLQDVPGFAFVAHVHRETFFSLRLSVLARLSRA